MSNSALRLPPYAMTIINSGSFNVTSSIMVVNGTNQLFDWVTINKPCVYPGEVYYRSGSGDFELASTVTDSVAEAIGIVEQTTPCANSSSLAKLVYYGKVTFDSSSVVLLDGMPYFLATSSAGTVYNTSSVSFRNVTVLEPDVSKPIFIATSTYEAVMVNYRGQVNSPVFSQSYLAPQSDWDCGCNEDEALPTIIVPAVEVFIGTTAPPSSNIGTLKYFVRYQSDMPSTNIVWTTTNNIHPYSPVTNNGVTSVINNEWTELYDSEIDYTLRSSASLYIQAYIQTTPASAESISYP